MNHSSSQKRSVNLWFTVIALLGLSACTETQVTPAPVQQLPVVELKIMKPRSNTNNQFMVLQEQYVQHIGTPGVFVLSADNTARFRMAKSGKSDGSWIEITSGLTGEEDVLLGPLDTVVDGSPVRVIHN
jgi:hypothetical protein